MSKSPNQLYSMCYTILLRIFTISTYAEKHLTFQSMDFRCVNTMNIKWHTTLQKKSSETNVSVYFEKISCSFRWADGFGNLTQPRCALDSLAFWQLNAFTFHAYNLFSKQHSLFYIFFYFYFTLLQQIRFYLEIFKETLLNRKGEFSIFSLSFSAEIEILWTVNEQKWHARRNGKCRILWVINIKVLFHFILSILKTSN